MMKHASSHFASGFALFLSIACAVHCMVMPFVLIGLPFLGNSILHHPLLEWSILATIVVLGQYSMTHYRNKHHGQSLPGRIFVGGVVICMAALLTSVHHEWITVVGSVVIAGSQVLNLTMKRPEKAG